MQTCSSKFSHANQALENDRYVDHVYAEHTCKRGTRSEILTDMLVVLCLIHFDILAVNLYIEKRDTFLNYLNDIALLSRKNDICLSVMMALVATTFFDQPILLLLPLFLFEAARQSFIESVVFQVRKTICICAKLWEKVTTYTRRANKLF